MLITFEKIRLFARVEMANMAVRLRRIVGLLGFGMTIDHTVRRPTSVAKFSKRKVLRSHMLTGNVQSYILILL